MIRHLLLLSLTSLTLHAAEPLFVAKPLTTDGLFTKGIEGPAVDRDGFVYAVNFEKQQTVGKVSPDGKAELFVTLPYGKFAHGIFRTASLLRHAVEKRRPNPVSIRPVSIPSRGHRATRRARRSCRRSIRGWRSC